MTGLVCGLLALFSGCGKGNDAEDDRASPTVASVSQAESPDEDAVLVTIDGESLTRSAAKTMVRQMAARQGVPPQMLDQFLSQMGERMEKEAIEQFVNHALMEKAAASMDIAVSAEELDAAVARLAETLPPDMTMDQALGAQNLTLADLRQNIESSERMRKLYETKTDDVEAATDAQVSEFYETNAERYKTEEAATANHILIACDENADAETHAKAKAEAEALLTQLEEGGDFAALALAHSSCPSKDKGGSLGTFGRGRMVPEFETAAFSQELGKVGSVVKTQFGYHLIQVTDRTEGKARSLEDVSEEIRTNLENQSRTERFRTYLDGLREQAEITYGPTPGS